MQIKPVFFALLTVFAFGSVVVVAQNKKKQKEPRNWSQVKAAKLKDKLKDEHKEQILEAIPAKATAEPKSERRILLFDLCEGYVHGSILHGNFAVEQLGEKTGAYQVDLYEDYTGFTKENLEKYDAIVFNNTSRLTPNESQREAILGFVKSGKGIVGIHAAADNFKTWTEGVAMIGGDFNGHPWNARGTWAFKLDDPEHPLNAAFEKEGFWYRDEIYWYNPDNFQGREKLRVLMSLDMDKKENQKAIGKKDLAKAGTDDLSKVDVPVSWIQKVGEGRVFYTNLGHNDFTFWNKKVLQHLLDGTQYALGDLEADSTPSLEMKDLKPALAPARE